MNDFVCWFKKIGVLMGKCRILEEMFKENVEFSRRSLEVDYDNNGK